MFFALDLNTKHTHRHAEFVEHMQVLAGGKQVDVFITCSQSSGLSLLLSDLLRATWRLNHFNSFILWSCGHIRKDHQDCICLTPLMSDCVGLSKGQICQRKRGLQQNLEAGERTNSGIFSHFRYIIVFFLCCHVKVHLSADRKRHNLK